jgi:PAS domain S-box-containing protein
MSEKPTYEELEQQIKALEKSVSECKQTEDAQIPFRWLLEKEEGIKTQSVDPAYDDVTALNHDGLILKAVGANTLKQLAGDVMDLLDTSTAVYEKNGDYAFGTFVSGWCGTLDNASRALCGTDDNRKALNCGKWLCHDSCWKISKTAIDSGKPVDEACSGGIRMYAVPIISDDQIIGAINFGYNSPPQTVAEQKVLAEDYHLDLKTIQHNAEAYKPRPPFIINVAKRRLQSIAHLIGEIVERKQAEEKLRESEERYRNLILTTSEGFWCLDLDKKTIDVNQSFCDMLGYSRREMIGKTPFDFVNDENLKIFKEQTSQTTDTFHRTYEIMLKKKNGTDLPTIFNATSLIDTKGKPAGSFAFVTDITEQKQAAEELKASSLATEISMNAIFAADLKGIITYANTSASKMWGYKCTEEMIGTNAIEYWTESTQGKAGEMIRTLLKEGNVANSGVLIGKRLDGTEFIVESNSVIIKDENGKPVGLIGSFSDITERKQLEFAINERLKELNCFYGVSKIVEIPDISIEEILRKVIKLVPTSWQYPEITVCRIILDGIEYKEPNFKKTKWVQSTDIRVADKNVGIIEIYNLVKMPDCDEGPFLKQERMLLYAIAERIGRIVERKQAEELLRNINARHSAMLENIGDVIVIMGADGMTKYQSPNIEKWFGWKPEDLIGTSGWDNVHPEDVERIQKEFSKMLEKETASIVELRFKCKNGSYKWIELTAVNRIKDPAINGVLLNYHDITERKQAEAEQEKLNDRLAQMQNLESLGLLAGGIAHDFNNILGGIYGYIDLALDDTTQESVSECLNESLSSIGRARSLTQQLLTFSKGGAPIKKEDSLFPGVQKTVEFALSGSSVSSSFQIQENLWSCNFDKNQIDQVVENLIINAKQAMPNGGTIEISARNLSLSEKEHDTLGAGNYVKLSIKDHGIGIPENFLPKIFDPYYTTKPQGHGLGLATCYSIVHRHGGCIDVESEPGEGCIFHLLLPASSAHIETSQGNVEGSQKHKGSGTFLVMDDEEAIRKITKRMLESMGYTVVLKENGKDAVDFFKTEIKANRKLAGMIFDLTIPGGMGGKEAIGEIRKICSETPVFVASGYSNDPIMTNPERYGFNAGISKPFQRADLSDMLKKYL